MPPIAPPATPSFTNLCNTPAEECPGVYITLNEVDPALLARVNNRVQEWAEAATADDNVTRRTHFIVDMDPTRLSGIPATDAEHAEALRLVLEVRDFLTAHGWPAPIHADSGNGGYLIYRINLANNPAATLLLHRCLLALAAEFDTGALHVDKGMYNAARVIRLIGTLNKKGDGTPDRPHRLSRLLDVPQQRTVVPADLLDALARMAPPEEPPRSQHQAHNGIGAADFLQKHNLGTSKVKPWQGGTLYELTTCPFNEGHTRTARVIQHASGAVSFQCFHSGCQGRDWHALRDLLEPDREGGIRFLFPIFPL
jgi:hypothetical protein